MIDSFTQSLMTQILARDVAAGVEFARQLGYAMPREFDVGVKFVFETRRQNVVWNTRVKLRLGDVTYDSLVLLPDLENPRVSLRETDALMQEAWLRLHADALTIAQVWIDKHPEASSVAQATAALRRLDDLSQDDELRARWSLECKERARQLRYTVRRAM